MANEMAFYNKLKELSMSQYGFRLGTGMPDAFADLVEHVTWILDEHKDVYVDVGKAFNSINHSILLHRNGFQGITHMWFPSFLQRSLQYGEIGECKSLMRFTAYRCSPKFCVGGLANLHT